MAVVMMFIARLAIPILIAVAISYTLERLGVVEGHNKPPANW